MVAPGALALRTPPPTHTHTHTHTHTNDADEAGGQPSPPLIEFFLRDRGVGSGRAQACSYCTTHYPRCTATWARSTGSREPTNEPRRDSRDLRLCIEVFSESIFHEFSNESM